MKVTIDIVGPLRVLRPTVDEEGVATEEELAIQGPTARALLAYLALHEGQQLRTTLVKALELGPDETQGLAQLRRALIDLKELKDAGAIEVRGRKTIELLREQVELPHLELLAVTRDNDATVEARSAAFERADRDTILAGLTRGDGRTWPWLEETRIAMRGMKIALCMDNAETLGRSGDRAGAVQWAKEWVRLETAEAVGLEPAEDAVLALMRRYVANSQEGAAVRARDEHKERLAKLGLGLPSQRFEDSAAQLVRTKGPKREVPLRAAALETPGPKFVGRAALITELTREVARSGDTRRVNVLQGAAGIGKTRVCGQVEKQWVDEARAEGPATLFGSFSRNGAVYNAFDVALGAYLEHTPGGPPGGLPNGAEHLRRLGPAVNDALQNEVPEPPSVDRGTDRRALFDAVGRILEQIADQGPTLLILENLHYADPSSLDLLANCISSTASAPLTFLLTTQPPGPGERRLARLLEQLQGDYPRAYDLHKLEPLSEIETAELVAERLSRHKPPAGRAAQIHKETGGWPFDVVQAADELLAELESAGSPLPGVVSRRAQEVLRVAALMGERFTLEGLTSVIDDPETNQSLLAHINETIDRGIVRRLDGGNWLAFSHGRQRQPFEPRELDIATDQYNGLIKRVAEYLAEQTPAPSTRIARLWKLAGKDAETVLWLRKAADDAANQRAYDVAADRLAEATKILREIDKNSNELCDALVELGNACWSAGRFAAANEAFAEATKVGSDPQLHARAALGYAGRLGFQGVTKGDDLAVMLGVAREGLGESEPDLRAELLACHAQALAFSNPESRDEGGKLAAEAVQLARRRYAEDPTDPARRELLIDVLCRTSWADWTPGNLHNPDPEHPGRFQLANEMVDLAEGWPARQLESRIFQICVLLEMGKIDGADGAREAWEAARGLADTLQQPYYNAIVKFIEGLFVMLEQPSAGDALSRAALEAGRRQEHPGVMQLFGAQALYVYLQADRADELFAASRDLVDYYKEFTAWQAGLALIHIESGRLDEGSRVIDRLIHPRDVEQQEDGKPQRPPTLPAEDLFWLISMEAIARVLCALSDAGQDRTADLTAVYAALEPYSDRYVIAGAAMAVHVPVVHVLGLVAAALGRNRQAKNHFDNARDLAYAVGCRPAEAEARIEFARAQLETEPHDVGLGQLRLHEAVTAIESHALTRLARRAADIATLYEAHFLVADLPDDEEAARSAELIARCQKVMQRGARPLPTTPLGRRTLSRVLAGGASRAKSALSLEDDTLDRIFGNHRRQQALFGMMARAYRPDRGFGFSGEVELGITLSEDETAYWTLVINGSDAFAENRRARNPQAAIIMGPREFVRLLTRDMIGIAGWLNRDLEVIGDPILAARMVEMFGGEAALSALT